MDRQEILTRQKLNLKPSARIRDTNKPYLYQRRMVLLMLTTARFVNGDDVGLGKTLEAIVTICYIKAANPDVKILVQTEKVALKQWLTEFSDLSVGFECRIITAETHPDKAQRISAFRNFSADVLITTYSSTYNYWKYMLEGMGKKWIYIADEPNYFKNIHTILHTRTNLMVNGEKPASRAYGLTATIIENRLDEAYGIFKIIDPWLFDSEVQFQRDYVRKKKTKGGKEVIVGYKNLGLFRKQIEKSFYGRLQENPEVEQELPEVIVKDVEIILGLQQSEKVLEAMDRIIQFPSGEVKQVQMLASLTYAQQLANDPRLLGFDIVGEKTKALMESLENSLFGQRVVIFSKLRRQINLLAEELRGKGLKFGRITGAETGMQKDEAKDRFMSDGRDHVPILLMTRAGQKAMNLQKGGHLKLFDLPWSYGNYRQIRGRLKRTGSIFKKIGLYRYLAILHPIVAARAGTSRTIDHHSLKVLNKKFQLWQAITGDADEVEDSASDIKDVFEEIRTAKK